MKSFYGPENREETLIRFRQFPRWSIVRAGNSGKTSIRRLSLPGVQTRYLSVGNFGVQAFIIERSGKILTGYWPRGLEFVKDADRAAGAARPKICAVSR